MPRIPRILALNKIDLLKGELLPEIAPKHYAAVVPLSALTGEGIETLKAEVERILAEAMVEIKLTLPHQRGDLLSLIHKYGVVDAEKHTEDGVTIRAHVPPRLVTRLSGLDDEPQTSEERRSS
jgi:GTP-binding protein HflX